MTLIKISRREFLEGTAAGLAAAGFGTRAALAADITLGIVYVGPRDDFGWNLRQQCPARRAVARIVRRRRCADRRQSVSALLRRKYGASKAIDANSSSAMRCIVAKASTNDGRQSG
jgi:hypothetical protein